MPDYQVLARRFRPQSFKDVIGQEAIVTTLKNAIKFNRLAQAYLFCGSRGTGKTTLARILAKALNCQQPTPDLEPCNQCSSCREITAGTSLDILEIDGASNRGIEDIRQINENVGYATASGHYKIYIIDEVHMLTKEAFNALLKTLEEPPPKVKFFFATTEPHKVLPTILSRCQRFNLNRIPLEKIVAKLQFIAKQMKVEVDEDALFLLARQAEGGLRDAESLFDQVLAFEEGRITIETINSILGLMPKDIYFEIDQAGKQGNLAKAFEVTSQVFSQGKDPFNFIEGLVEHLRTILLVKLSKLDATFIPLSPTDRQRYEESAKLYHQEQCLNLIEYLMTANQQMRLATSSKIALETILLHVLRSHFQIPIEILVRRLSELESLLGEETAIQPSKPAPAIAKVAPPKPIPSVILEETQAPSKPVAPQPSKPAPIISKVASKPAPSAVPSMSLDPTPSPADLGLKPVKAAQPSMPLTPKATTQKPPHTTMTSISEDPTPSPADLGLKPVKIEAKPVAVAPREPLKKPVHHYDTLLHFAAVELEGKIQKTN